MSAEYSDYADVFSFNLAMELPKNISISKYVIELVEGKQPLYDLIYTLNLVELETLKVYIKTYLKTGFIKPSIRPLLVLSSFLTKFLTAVSIFISIIKV